MNTRRLTMTIASCTIALLALLVISTSAAPLRQADPPERVTYQGHLLDSANDPVPDDDYSMTFRLYDSPTSGTLVWGPETYTVTTSAGYFSVLLGETTPITAGTFAANTYLEVTVDGETLTPRHQFASVPFALIASDVSETTLGDLDCTTDQIAQWNGTAWECATPAGGGGISLPVGSIIAWHKSYTNTPALPTGWLECNGQTINDEESPYNGQTLPNLNSDTQDGSTNSGMFLRGASTSGTLQADATAVNGLSIAATNGTKRTNYGMATDFSSDSPGSISSSDNETRPANMTVVWIIRIK